VILCFLYAYAYIYILIKQSVAQKVSHYQVSSLNRIKTVIKAKLFTILTTK